MKAPYGLKDLFEMKVRPTYRIKIFIQYMMNVLRRKNVKKYGEVYL
ncbi:nucleotidyltransferase family protein [Oceanobacillus sp. APA_J-5(13-2)]|nr:nucleotidyltransferase family protein [Oceanobacillus alkalisoli]MCG5104220.1 nucleotidyltransferase family protein [Oceanobacillus alkalisoli]